MTPAQNLFIFYCFVMAFRDGCRQAACSQKVKYLQVQFNLDHQNTKVASVGRPGRSGDYGEGDGPDEEKKCMKCVIHAEEIEN